VAKVKLSSAQCSVKGEHALPVKSDAAAPAMSDTFFLVRAISWTASAAEEKGRSAMTSTFSVSNHRRAIVTAMSVLFWKSASITTMGFPRTDPPKSRTAIRAAYAALAPLAKAPGPA